MSNIKKFEQFKPYDSNFSHSKVTNKGDYNYGESAYGEHEEKIESSYMSIQHLNSLKEKCEEMVEMLGDNPKLESWVESHITEAKTKIEDVYDYLKYGDKQNESFELNKGIEFIDQFIESETSDELKDVMLNEIGYVKKEMYNILEKYENKNELFNYWLISIIRNVNWDDTSSTYVLKNISKQNK